MILGTAELIMIGFFSITGVAAYLMYSSTISGWFAAATGVGTAFGGSVLNIFTHYTDVLQMGLTGQMWGYSILVGANIFLGIMLFRNAVVHGEIWT